MHHDASLNIRQLQVFEAVARLESYSRAQQELGISVSAISNAMSQLGEGANKQVISSQADSLIKISRIWADFFPANTSNQPI